MDATHQHPHQQGEEHEQDDLPQLTEDDVEEIHNDGEEDGEGQGDEPMSEGEDGDDDDKVVLHDSSISAFYGSKGESIFTISLHPNYPSTPLAVSGGSDDRAFVWRVAENGECEVVQQLEPSHKDSVTMVSWSSDGSLLATGGMDGLIHVFSCSSPSTFTHLTTLEGGDEVQFLLFHPKGPVLAAGYADSTVWMWSLPAATLMNVFTGHEEGVTAGRFTPDGKRLLTTSTDGSLLIYDPRQATPLAKLGKGDARFGGIEGGFISLACSPDNRLAAVGSVTGQSRLVSLTGVEQGGGMAVVAALEGHTPGESIEGLAFISLLGDPSSASHLITAGTDGRAIVWDLQTQRVRQTCLHVDSPDSNEAGALTTLVVHGSGPLFTTASSGGTLRSWDARSGATVARHEGFVDGVLDADVRPNGRGGWTVVGAGDEGVALVFSC